MWVLLHYFFEVNVFEVQSKGNIESRYGQTSAQDCCGVNK